MKKKLVTVLLALSMTAAVVGCGNSDETIEEDYTEFENSEDMAEEDYEDLEEYEEEYSLSLYANGGTIYYDAEEPYQGDMSAYSMEEGEVLGDVISDEILSVEKEDAAFLGWQVYTSGSYEMSDEEVTVLEEGEECIDFGEYGYVVLSESEAYDELLSTEQLRSITSEAKDYWAIAEWE